MIYAFESLSTQACDAHLGQQCHFAVSHVVDSACSAEVHDTFGALDLGLDCGFFLVRRREGQAATKFHGREHLPCCLGVWPGEGYRHELTTFWSCRRRMHRLAPVYEPWPGTPCFVCGRHPGHQCTRIESCTSPRQSPTEMTMQ